LGSCPSPLVLDHFGSEQNELLAELQRVPMFVETPSTIKKKFAIEQQIAQVEDAIKVFSRKIGTHLTPFPALPVPLSFLRCPHLPALLGVTEQFM
jgi:hypothetical protein